MTREHGGTRAEIRENKKTIDKSNGLETRATGSETRAKIREHRNTRDKSNDLETRATGSETRATGSETRAMTGRLEQ